MLPPASAVPTVSQVTLDSFCFRKPQAENKHKKTRQSANTARFFLAAKQIGIPQLLLGFRNK
jgi:hypothetical protein